MQSSCLALMAAKGEIGPMPDAAIFADTQAEPLEVYRWLDWLEKQLPFPVIRVSRGSLADEETKLVLSGKSGKLYTKNRIPAFVTQPDGSIGLLGRKCTSDFKIEPILKLIRKIAGIKRGQKQCTVTQWIGISWDELQRMKEGRHPWLQNRWPLIEKRMTRQKCLQWMASNGFPEPPRSACSFCPFHSDNEWRRLRDSAPDEWQKVITFEKALQKAVAGSQVMTGTPFLHRSCKPIAEVDFSTDEERGQGVFDFQAECEGLCGV